MKYSFVFYGIVLALMIGGFLLWPRRTEAPAEIVAFKSAPKAEANNKNRVVLAVPYISEAPEGIWKQPWANACEEASVMMVDEFYKGSKSVSVAHAKEYMLNLFAEEEVRYESSRNADGLQIADMSRRFASFNAELKENPTMDEIKAEIKAGRPVITLHRGFDLHNPNIEFSPTLSSYHTIVVVGFDDDKKVFITNDPGDEKAGANHEYGYDLFMNSLHDYNAADNLADGTPSAVFTSISI
ncbi:MAG: C39 family peptidase [Patescibacteria group bacterium]